MTKKVGRPKGEPTTTASIRVPLRHIEDVKVELKKVKRKYDNKP